VAVRALVGDSERLGQDVQAPAHTQLNRDFSRAQSGSVSVSTAFSMGRARGVDEGAAGEHEAQRHPDG
jgi:hypothetical protein